MFRRVRSHPVRRASRAGQRALRRGWQQSRRGLGATAGDMPRRWVTAVDFRPIVFDSNAPDAYSGSRAGARAEVFLRAELRPPRAQLGSVMNEAFRNARHRSHTDLVQVPACLTRRQLPRELPQTASNACFSGQRALPAVGLCERLRLAQMPCQRCPVGPLHAILFSLYPGPSNRPWPALAALPRAACNAAGTPHKDFRLNATDARFRQRGPVR